MIAVKKNQVWMHNNGNKYTVIGFANEYTSNPTKYPVTVIYRGHNGRVWSRPLEDWHHSFIYIDTLFSWTDFFKSLLYMRTPTPTLGIEQLNKD